MTWITQSNNPVGAPYTDWNEEFKVLLDQAELPEDVARKTLGRFLMHNPGMMVEILTRKMLEPYQRIVIKGWLQKNFSLTIAGRSFGKCIDKNALVLTDKGLIRIGDVQVGDEIWANKASQRVLAKIENPKEDGFRVETNRGYTCTGKMGHKIWTFNPTDLTFNWTDIENLKESDLIPIRHGMGRWTDATPISDYVHPACSNHNGHAREIVLTEGMDLYYLMGLLLGDGSMRQPGGSIVLTSMDVEVKNCIESVCSRCIPGASIRAKQKKEGLASDYIFCSTRFKAFLRYMGFNDCKAHQKAFPERILSVDETKTSAFLRGLFDTDGCCTYNESNHRCTVEFASSSKDIIEKTQVLLLNYGILSTVRHKHKAGLYRFSNGKDYQTNDAWDLAIFDRQSLAIFSAKIGFGIKRKQDPLTRFLNTANGNEYKHNLIPVGSYFIAKYGQAFRRHSQIRIHDSISIARLTEFLQFDFVDESDKAKIRSIIESGCYFDPISTITPTQTETIDIQVDNEECYWSGGFISHNSTIASHFCYLYCLLNPGHHILICAATFRSSRQIVERIDEWANSKDGLLLRETLKTTPTGGTIIKKQDLMRVWFKNGSSVTAVPLGDPDNLRGFRCNVLMIDEGLLISQHTINMVLKPFLAGGADATKKQRIRRKENRLIEMGKMMAKEKAKFAPDSKMIVISSASYSWEELYTDMYKPYRAIIESVGETKVQGEENAKGISSYLVHQLSYKMTNPDLMDAGILEEIREKRIPESVIKREYEAQFVNESGGFFSAKQMNDCTIPLGQRPHIEIVGESDAEYVLGIDPAGGAIGADPAGDHFAMCVLKICNRAKDGKKYGMVVHQYGCAGVDLKHHIAYLYYILNKFKIVYIVIDSSGGENVDFLKICNESEYFKSRKMELNSINAEFAKEGFDETVEAVRRSYNPDRALRRIVHNQYFSSSIIKAGNDNLRAAFEQKTIQFASKAGSVDGAVQALCQQDVLDIHNKHPEYHDADLDGSSSMYDFVLYQDYMIDLVKKECALIEVTSSLLGHLAYDLPHHMTRNRKNINRNRKDNYSALWLAAWGLKIYLAMNDLPPPEDDTFIPVMLPLR